jgi:hypothetical protein
MKLYQVLKLLDDTETIFIYNGDESIEIVIKDLTPQKILDLPLESIVLYVRVDYQEKSLILSVKGDK